MTRIEPGIQKHSKVYEYKIGFTMIYLFDKVKD
jgi:hypothetical protein